MGLDYMDGWRYWPLSIGAFFGEIFFFDGAERAKTIITSNSMIHIIVSHKKTKLSLSVGDRVLYIGGEEKRRKVSEPPQKPIMRPK
jgi:hypothetical protein